MLSDEEKQAMESLIEIREFANLSNYKDTKISQLNAIDIVLNLIEKQQKQIEKLKEKCKELIFEKQELTSALLDSTPNDKIKAKIEYCREILYSFEKELELKANKDKFIHKESMNCLLGQISILQSLLEKE